MTLASLYKFANSENLEKFRKEQQMKYEIKKIKKKQEKIKKQEEKKQAIINSQYLQNPQPIQKKPWNPFQIFNKYKYNQL